ncbi:TetR/AcrR family transcriptional regulator [Trinickia terrae]|uniref:TetR/AcrR family transcriptional regulator n=1 Tax=Trinickia terrae TaxID=2571161 RepID=A0A4U1HYV1_9BURK|nr:TetR/AcrR family transcriptional regulator [Trinickia terrae]TKC85878.1 TetR/AcrR family transcriptional regulator [Trinickia terrae]
METSTVREQLLEQALTLMMTHGYNAFSYRDLSALVGVKTSSIHYYFPKKEDLALEAVNVYSTEVMASIRGIDEALPADKKLDRYAKLFGRVMGDGNQVCLCGMLAADIASLPEDVRHAVQAFYKTNEAWLTKVLEGGQAEGTLRFNGKAESVARTLFASFQGSVMASRLFHSKARLEEVVGTVKAA